MSANAAGSGLLTSQVDPMRNFLQPDLGRGGLPITGAGGAAGVLAPGGGGGGAGAAPIEPGLPGTPTPGEVRRSGLSRSREAQVLAQGTGSSIVQLAAGYRAARDRLLGGGA